MGNRGATARDALLLVALLLLVWTAGPAAARDEASVESFAREAARNIGFSEEEVAQVAKGKVLARQLRDEQENELNVVLFALAPVTVERAAERFKTNAALDADKTILDWGSIDADPTAESFEKLSLPQEEIAKLAGKNPGKEFNLSKAEIAKLEASGEGAGSKAERGKAAMQAYREILAKRAAAYQARGLEGILPYHRNGKAVQPAEDLRGTVPGPNSLTEREEPGFRKWLGEFPKAGEVDESEFVWLLQVLNGRPAVILAHRGVRRGEKALFGMQRDYYVGHTFDALQILTGLVPAGEDQSILFYMNATFTDQVTGFGSSAAHGIGRKIMAKEIRTLFETVVEDLQ